MDLERVRMGGSGARARPTCDCIQDGGNSFNQTDAKFKKFMETLSCHGDKKAADLIRRVVTNQFEDEFKDIAACGATFADRFGTAASDEDDPDKNCLLWAITDYRNSLREAPIQVTEQEDPSSAFVTEDIDSEFTSKLYKQVVSMRKNRCVFYNFENWQREPWKRGGQATAIVQRSKFATAKGEAGKDNTLILLSAEMFPCKEMFQKATSYKDPVPLSDDIKAAARWATSARQNDTVCAFGDGRSRKIRKAFEDIVEDAQCDEQKQLDICIVYGVPGQKDIRFPKRKTFAGLYNREAIAGILPVPKVRMSSKTRQHFSACGETSTYATSYTNVSVRRLNRLPRMTVPDKEGIVGFELPTYPEEVTTSTGTKGHPLFWNETKDIDMFLALFKDLNVHHVLDLTPGSGAAAMAALIMRIGYEGIAMNVGHANWLNRILDKAMFAIIADATDEETKKIQKDVMSHFSAQIEEARDFLLTDNAMSEEEEEESDVGNDGEPQN